MAAERNVPLFEILRTTSEELIEMLTQLKPQLIIVSCFPWRISRQVASLAPAGAVNLHPSLLPQFRGPEPLFWALQTGATMWGVTVHQLSEHLDSGPILRQRTFDITPDTIEGGLESVSSDLGAQTLIEVIDDVQKRTVTLVSQDESQASYLGYPTDADLSVQSNWSVRHLLNFVAGAIQLGYQPRIVTDRGAFDVVSARESVLRSGTGDVEWIDRHHVILRLPDGAVELQLLTEIG